MCASQTYYIARLKFPQVPVYPRLLLFAANYIRLRDRLSNRIPTLSARRGITSVAENGVLRETRGGVRGLLICKLITTIVARPRARGGYGNCHAAA